MATADTLLRELRKHLKTFTKDLEVMGEIMTKSTEAGSKMVRDALIPIWYENQRILRRFKEGCQQIKGTGKPFIMLANVWKPERMKPLYYLKPEVIAVARKIWDEYIKGFMGDVCPTGYLSNAGTFEDVIHSYLPETVQILNKIKALGLSNGEKAAVENAIEGLKKVINFCSETQPTFKSMNPVKLLTVPLQVRFTMGEAVVLGQHKFFVCESGSSNACRSRLDSFCGQTDLPKVQLIFTSENLAIRRIVGIPKFVMDRWECVPILGTTVEIHPAIGNAITIKRDDPSFLSLIHI